MSRSPKIVDREQVFSFIRGLSTKHDITEVWIHGSRRYEFKSGDVEITGGYYKKLPREDSDWDLIFVTKSSYKDIFWEVQNSPFGIDVRQCVHPSDLPNRKEWLEKTYSVKINEYIWPTHIKD